MNKTRLIDDQDVFIKESALVENFELFKELLTEEIDILYCKDLHLVFAVSTFQSPTADYPYVDFKGWNISKYAFMPSAPADVLKVIRKLLQQEPIHYKFSSSLVWMFEEAR